MTQHFCTILSGNFVHRTLALHTSLLRHAPNFTLWALCLDTEARELFQKLNLQDIILLTPEELNDAEYLTTRTGRTVAEFSWTSKPPLLIHVMGHIAEGEGVTYLDSDLFLFSSPEALYGSLGDASIAITPHRLLPPNPEREKEIGRFNAGWIYARKDATSRACLSEWRSQCIEWCFNIKEEQRFGDQKYLTAWPEQYPNVHIINHDGINAGPWNISGKNIRYEDGTLFIDTDPLVFYHFHGLKAYRDSRGAVQGYPISMINSLIYNPYIEALQRAIECVRVADSGFVVAFDAPPSVLRLLKQRLFKLLYA